MLRNCLLVGIGGFAGSIARYLLTVLASHMAVSPVLATFAANLSGAFLIGLFMATLQKDALLVASVGFCGGFTTFSTFSAQTLQMFQDGKYTVGLLYITGSLLLSVIFVYIGFYIGKRCQP